MYRRNGWVDENGELGRKIRWGRIAKKVVRRLSIWSCDIDLSTGELRCFGANFRCFSLRAEYAPRTPRTIYLHVRAWAGSLTSHPVPPQIQPHAFHPIHGIRSKTPENSGRFERMRLIGSSA